MIVKFSYLWMFSEQFWVTENANPNITQQQQFNLSGVKLAGLTAELLIFRLVIDHEKLMVFHFIATQSFEMFESFLLVAEQLVSWMVLVMKSLSVVSTVAEEAWVEIIHSQIILCTP